MTPKELAAKAAALYARMDADIARTGRSIIGVMDASTPFSYTIGNHLEGYPELIMFGLHPRDAMMMLNIVSELPMLRHIRNGELVSVGGTFPMLALDCRESAKTRYAVQAERYLHHADFRLLQLVAPDRQGRFPGDPDCDPAFVVPLLGTRPLPSAAG
jgi:hypothetical protein